MLLYGAVRYGFWDLQDLLDVALRCALLLYGAVRDEKVFLL